MTELSKVEWAYLAGLFDGEGYIRFSFKKHWHGRPMNTEFWITVTNTYEPILDYLMMLFGGSKYATQPRSGKGKMCYFWKLTTRDAFIVLSRMAPYLKIKRERANHILRNRALITRKGPRSDSDRKALIALTKKMSALTKRGKS